MKRCGAKTRNGKKCQNQAGSGTDHIGSGKCKLHGGLSTGAPKGNQNALKHGIYSRLFSTAELDQAKEMQGSIETELAIARLQLLQLLQEQKQQKNNPVLDKIEEKTIVQDSPDGEKKNKKKLEEELKDRLFGGMSRSAKQCGEYYDPDGDEVYLTSPSESTGSYEQESEVFERKRVYQRRDFQNDFIRLTTLIARLEQQLLQAARSRVELEIIKKGEKTGDDIEQFTDVELDNELQKLIGGLPI